MKYFMVNLAFNIEIEQAWTFFGLYYQSELEDKLRGHRPMKCIEWLEWLDENQIHYCIKVENPIKNLDFYLEIVRPSDEILFKLTWM